MFLSLNVQNPWARYCISSLMKRFFGLLFSVRGVVDLTNNSDLFTTVLDMINILIHSTLITDRESSGNSERSEETRKHYNYHALVKKLKKEIGEKTSPSLKYLRQLLPIPKLMTEVIVTEPFGLINEKGTKVKGLNCDKKPGMTLQFRFSKL